MTYVLEDISISAQDKILYDAKSFDTVEKQFLARGGYFSSPNRRWAVDQENDCYLLVAPVHSRSKRHYYFFYKNEFYLIHVASQIDPVVYFQKSEPPESVLEDIKYELKKAFLVHGYLGFGNFGSFEFHVKFESTTA